MGDYSRMLGRPDLVCWKCGASLEMLHLPLRRLEVCPTCDSELHVCRMCVSYDPDAIDQCTEEAAEEVREKERANFCDYYKPRPGAHRPRDPSPATAARNRLDALFDGGPEPETDTGDAGRSTRERLEDLFKPR